MASFLQYPCEFLNLERTLTCGQAFRWKLDQEGWWSAPVQNKLIRIRRTDDGFMWETHPGEPDSGLIIDYFRFSDDVPSIYSNLAEKNGHIAGLLKTYEGLRLLRQQPTETLLSYICSTANSVTRISRAIDELSRKLGDFIVRAGGIDHYSFPDIQTLALVDPDELSGIGSLAWRGRSMVSVAQQLLEREPGWLEQLKREPYEYAKAELVKLRGVGAKIADCVCLFSLDKDEAVPVDTHIRQVAARYFMPDLTTKTITPAAYSKIVQVFHNAFGHYAGWAQEFLYLEDLSRGRMHQ